MSGQQQRDRFENYVPVAERIEQFYDKFPTGRILTTLLEHNAETGFVLIRAEAYRTIDDALPASTGHAYEVRGEGFVNKTSYIENCETGAVGRALALLGFEVRRGIASREEMQKTDRQAPTNIKIAPNTPPVKARAVDEDSELDTEISTLLSALGKESGSFSAYVQKTYNVKGMWFDQSVELKRTLRDYLLNLQKKAARA